MSLLDFRLFCEENGIAKIKLCGNIEFSISTIVVRPNIILLTRNGEHKPLYGIKKIEVEDLDFETNNYIAGTIYQIGHCQPNQTHKIDFVGF